MFLFRSSAEPQSRPTTATEAGVNRGFRPSRRPPRRPAPVRLPAAHRPARIEPAARRTGLHLQRAWPLPVHRFDLAHHGEGRGRNLGLTQYAEKIGRDSNGRPTVSDPAMRQQILALRDDPAVSPWWRAPSPTAMLGHPLRHRPQSDRGELYMAHFLGSGGATRLIAANESNPQATAARLFPDAAMPIGASSSTRAGRAPWRRSIRCSPPASPGLHGHRRCADGLHGHDARRRDCRPGGSERLVRHPLDQRRSRQTLPFHVLRNGGAPSTPSWRRHGRRSARTRRPPRGGQRRDDARAARHHAHRIASSAAASSASATSAMGARSIRSASTRPAVASLSTCRASSGRTCGAEPIANGLLRSMVNALLSRAARLGLCSMNFRCVPVPCRGSGSPDDRTSFPAVDSDGAGRRPGRCDGSSSPVPICTPICPPTIAARRKPR